MSPTYRTKVGNVFNKFRDIRSVEFCFPVRDNCAPNPVPFYLSGDHHLLPSSKFCGDDNNSEDESSSDVTVSAMSGDVPAHAPGQASGTLLLVLRQLGIDPREKSWGR